MIDIGSGTGILPIVISEVGGYKGKIYAIDSQTNCIESTKMNCQIFGLADKINPLELDLLEFYYPRESKFS